MLSKASVYDPDDLSKKALYAQFNPNTLEYSAGANRYADKRVRDTGSTAREHLRQGDPTGRTGNASLSVRLFCHTYENESSYTDVRLDVNRFRKFLRHTDETGKTISPRIGFAWGTLCMVGTLESISVSYQMFASDGTPVQAEVSLMIMGDAPDITAMQSNYDKEAAVKKDPIRLAAEKLKDADWLFL